MDYLFPPYCAGCNTLGQRFCSDCRKSIIPLFENSVCDVCGTPLTTKKCRSCLTNKFEFKSVKSWGIYSRSLREAIHSLKFKRNFGLGIEFAPDLRQIILKAGWLPDILVPVPVSKKRKNERGYNQAEIIAFPLALSLRLAYKPQALSKPADTRSQVGLTPLQRFENTRHTFRAEEKLVVNKSILLVDDVTTTGATLNACAHELLMAGASKVYCITIAKAILNTDLTDEYPHPISS